MSNAKKVFYIHGNSEEDVERLNKIEGNSYKTTQQHFDDTIAGIAELILKCGDKGGWYVGDSLKVTVEVEYIPEDK